MDGGMYRCESSNSVGAPKSCVAQQLKVVDCGYPGVELTTASPSTSVCDMSLTVFRKNLPSAYFIFEVFDFDCTSRTVGAGRRQVAERERADTAFRVSCEQCEASVKHHSITAFLPLVLLLLLLDPLNLTMLIVGASGVAAFLLLCCICVCICRRRGCCKGE